MWQLVHLCSSLHQGQVGESDSCVAAHVARTGTLALLVDLGVLEELVSIGPCHQRQGQKGDCYVVARTGTLALLVDLGVLEELVSIGPRHPRQGQKGDCYVMARTGTLALLVDLGVLAELVSIGTLFVFFTVSAGLIWRRFTAGGGAASDGVSALQKDDAAKGLGAIVGLSFCERPAVPTIGLLGAHASAWAKRVHSHLHATQASMCAPLWLTSGDRSGL